MTMNTNIEVEVSELTKTYAILNGEKIVFDEADLHSVAEWMNVPLESLVFQYRLVPISIFAKQAEDMFGTYDEFPQDKKRTDKISKIIKRQPAYPVFVEMDDPANFIMEGRHRIVAFWQAGMQQVPVFYVGVGDSWTEIWGNLRKPVDKSCPKSRFPSEN
jgi:hypothetical protein